jgi:hypothetical protein
LRRLFPQLTAAFNQTLKQQGTSFQVQATGAGSQQQLTITTTGARPPIKPIQQTVNGRVVGGKIAELNGNGTPEIYVFVQGAGSGSTGELVAYAVINSSDLSPIYKPGDTNANATGGERQICYKLQHGEASWILRPTSPLLRPAIPPSDRAPAPIGGPRATTPL